MRSEGEFGGEGRAVARGVGHALEGAYTWKSGFAPVALSATDDRRAHRLAAMHSADQPHDWLW